MKRKVGIFLNDKEMGRYSIDDYAMALEALAHAYQETGVPHELIFFDEE